MPLTREELDFMADELNVCAPSFCVYEYRVHFSKNQWWNSPWTKPQNLNKSKISDKGRHRRTPIYRKKIAKFAGNIFDIFCCWHFLNWSSFFELSYTVKNVNISLKDLKPNKKRTPPHLEEVLLSLDHPNVVSPIFRILPRRAEHTDKSLHAMIFVERCSKQSRQQDVQFSNKFRIQLQK